VPEARRRRDAPASAGSACAPCAPGPRRASGRQFWRVRVRPPSGWSRP